MEILLGAVVSALVQWLKQDVESEYVVILMVAALSLIAAATYTILVATNLWVSTAQIFTVAGAFYAYIWIRFESVPSSTTDPQNSL